MRTINSFILLCVFCLFCQPTLAQRRVRLADLPPFERAVVVVKYFEGLHGWKNYPYVGYGHQLQRGEHFTADMTERQARLEELSVLSKDKHYPKIHGRIR